MINKVIQNHSVKITIGTIITILSFVVYWTAQANTMINQINQNADEIEKINKQMPSMNNDVVEIKNDIKWIKQYLMNK